MNLLAGQDNKLKFLRCHPTLTHTRPLCRAIKALSFVYGEPLRRPYSACAFLFALKSPFNILYLPQLHRLRLSEKH